MRIFNSRSSCIPINFCILYVRTFPKVSVFIIFCHKSSIWSLYSRFLKPLVPNPPWSRHVTVSHGQKECPTELRSALRKITATPSSNHLSTAHVLLPVFYFSLLCRWWCRTNCGVLRGEKCLYMYRVCGFWCYIYVRRVSLISLVIKLLNY